VLISWLSSLSLVISSFSYLCSVTDRKSATWSRFAQPFAWEKWLRFAGLLRIMMCQWTVSSIMSVLLFVNCVIQSYHEVNSDNWLHLWHWLHLHHLRWAIELLPARNSTPGPRMLIDKIVLCSIYSFYCVITIYLFLSCWFDGRNKNNWMVSSKWHDSCANDRLHPKILILALRQPWNLHPDPCVAARKGKKDIAMELDLNAPSA